MEHMGITGKYLNLVKEIYNNISSKVSINGWMDERFLGHFFALSRLNWAGDNLD